MCGIAGFFSSKYTTENLQFITDLLTHRGPDVGGYVLKDICGLGHRRLSIIDLSEVAHQPMISHSAKHIMVFNGEIYNYKEIAKDVLAANPSVKYRSHSDTEVILEAFEIWGPLFVERLNGMFAIAIYSIEERKLYLFRDRMGVKPLYIHHRENSLIFASELKSIVALLKKEGQLSVNPTAVTNFMHLGYIPSPYTIYNEVTKFPKASYAVFDGEKLTTHLWWSLNEKIRDISNFSIFEAKEELKSLLISSVKYRLISDVPFGTFLSGGIDSSIVTAIAQSISTNPINTFSIGFEDSKHNEAPFAKKIANFLGTNHQEFILKYKDALDIIPKMQSMYDEPFADSSAIPTFLVSKMAKKKVTMTLSGDGGDELFLGYGAYNWASRMNNPLLKYGHNFASSFLKMGSNKYKRVSNLLSYPSNTFIQSHLFSQEQYFFSVQELNLLLKSEVSNLNFSQFLQPTNRKLSSVEKQALFDLHYYLPDDLLVKVDRASMQNSIEARVPLLDYRIVEFALNLPQNYKKKGSCSKFLLKEVLFDYIPKEFFDRPKWGFSIPLDKWMMNELKEEIEAYIFLENEFINTNYVKLLYKRFCNNETFLYQRIWAIYVFNKFLETQNNQK